MGNLCCRKRIPRRKIVLLLLGLDNAGKTVAVQNLTGEKTPSVMPTVGFSIVELKYSKYDIKVFDLGGRLDFRDVWPRYFVDAHGIIFVVDASDYGRISEAHTVLENIVTNSKIRGKPILVLANKQDQDEALDEIDLIDKLELESLANDNECPTFITSCCAGTGSTEKMDSNIKTGYNWLIKSIIGDFKHLQKRVDEDVKGQKLFDEEERRERLFRIRRINEEEALAKQNKMASPAANGTVADRRNDRETFIVVKESNGVKSIPSTFSLSASSSTSIESIPIHDEDLVSELLPESNSNSRPESATSLIRRQLALANLKRRPSLQLTHNKTTPVHLFGVRSKTANSANRQRTGTKQAPDRRNLRSAGDSIFIVSRDNHRVMPSIDGSGDLTTWRSPIRQFHQYKQTNVIKDVLPPIDVHVHKSLNGTYF